MGKSSSQVVGYKYFLGMHVVLAQNLDSVLALKFQDSIAWAGTVASGRIKFNRPALFGGEGREGGVSGNVDVMLGEVTQPRNDYLQSILGTEIPAFRGVASLVFRQSYFGNNPYIKPLSVKAKAINSHFDNWYPEKATIHGASDVSGAGIYLALDDSQSMNGTTQINQKIAVVGFLEGLKGSVNNIKIITYSQDINSSIERFQCSDSDYDALIAFVQAIPDSGSSPIGTNFNNALAQAAAFYTAVDSLSAGVVDNTFFGAISDNTTGAAGAPARRVILFTTDGEGDDATLGAATIDAIDDVEVYAFSIDHADTTQLEIIDNTPTDNVPVVSGGDPDALRVALGAAFQTWADMNPAHILRDVIIAPSSDGSGDATEIGTSFTTAADQLFTEGFGLSFFWQNSGSKGEFKKLVEEHIDASVFLDRGTGKWEIKLIRDDYSKPSLPVFNKLNISEWVDEPVKPEQAELANQITVKYTKRATGETGSVTLTNIAGVQAAGRIINEPRTYEGITRHLLASQVCQRDLAAITTPLTSGAFKATFADPDINIGTPIVVDEPKLGMNSVVVRITEIEDSDGRDNRVLIRFVEDKFSLPDEVLVVEDVVTVENNSAIPSTIRLVEEVPYYELVQRQGQTAVDDELLSEPDGGIFHATGNQPSGAHQNAIISVDAGSGWMNDGHAEFSPTSTLVTALTSSADDLTVEIENTANLINVVQGTLALIGSEYLRVDDMVLSGSNILVTFGRGCLDTVLETHGIGDTVIFWQDNTGSDEAVYLASESIDIKLRPQTGADVVSIAAATTDNVVFDSRAIRPYPVGKLQVEGSYSPTDVLTGSVTSTWAHRDRTIQTTASIEDHTFGDIGPEAGVSYHAITQAIVGKEDVFAETDWFSDVSFFEADARVSLSETALVSAPTTVDFNADNADFFTPVDFFAETDVYENSWPENITRLEFGIRTDRSGYENWQTPFMGIYPLLPPNNLHGVFL